MENAVWIKICGITCEEDVLKVSRAGAHAIGLMFYPNSPRFVNIEMASSITKLAKGHGLEVVGVFVNESLDKIVSAQRTVKFDIIQLHGDEGCDFARNLKNTASIPVYKAIEMNDHSFKKAYEEFNFLDALLLDYRDAESFGGTGKSFDWDLLREGIPKIPPTIIAGGLTPNNVSTLKQFKRFDVSSGVESGKGIKDSHKLQSFVAAATGKR